MQANKNSRVNEQIHKGLDEGSNQRTGCSQMRLGQLSRHGQRIATWSATVLTRIPKLRRSLTGVSHNFSMYSGFVNQIFCLYAPTSIHTQITIHNTVWICSFNSLYVHIYYLQIFSIFSSDQRY